MLPSPGRLLALCTTAALFLSVRADVITRIPDAAPPGFEQWVSSIVLPAKNVSGDSDWSSAVAKARAFVARLTLDEKVNLTTGIGINGRCVGNTGEITRLGFKGICLQDSPLGVRFADFVSAFPTSVNTAATFDKDLIYQRGQAMGAEHRGKGVNVALGPMTNLGRVAAGGRNWEGWGADPYLAGVATAETVRGIQSQGVISCVKHFIANEQEHFRGGSESPQIYSSDVDDRTLHEVYAWPFAEAVRVGVGAIMSSYNKINQTQACQNSKLINGVIKEELDFQGFVVSDWAAMINGVQPALAGLDMNMPGFLSYNFGSSEPNPDNTTNSWWGSALIESVKNGSVPEWRVDDMVTRTMAAFYKLGQDSGYPPINFASNFEGTYSSNGALVNEHVNVQADHYKLIREIGSASTILLKNTNGALPLNINKLKRLAILGDDAGPNPDGPNGCGDRSCDQGTLAMGWGSGTANFPYLIDPSSAIQRYVNYRKPTVVMESVLNNFNLGQVKSVSSQSDVCLVFANADSGEGYITIDNNAGDRNNLTLWKSGEDLITATASVCSNTIVVLHIVGPVLVESWIDHPNVTAVLHAGLPGQESGNALTDVLFGIVNPSARLPYTIARSRTDYPADVLYSSTMQTPQIVYDEKLEMDYRHFDAHNISPRFEFGFGLSYTTFSYDWLYIQSGDEVKSTQQRRAVNASATGAAVPDVSSAAPKAAVTILGSTPAAAKHSTSGAKPTPSPTAVNATSTAAFNASTTARANSTSTLPMNATATSSAPPAISSPAQTSPGGTADLFDTLFTVFYAITNTGKADGHEVSQLYLGFPPSANEPPRVLRGFDRSFINQGESAFITLPLRRKDISVWDVVTQKWSMPRGVFKVEVGSSSRNIHLTGYFSTDDLA